MTELEELKSFINTSAFSLLSEEAQKDVCSKITALEEQALSKLKASICNAIKEDVKEAVGNADIELSLLVTYGSDKEVCVQEYIPVNKKSADNFSVAFDNGDTICGQNALDTFVQALQRIGLMDIPNLGITFGRINLVSVIEKDSAKQKEVDGVYVYTDLTKEEMINVLKEISEKKYLNLAITDAEALKPSVAEKANEAAEESKETISHEESASGTDTTDAVYKAIIFDKEVDWSFLNRGFTIPQTYHYAVEKAFGKDLDKGSVEIKIVLNQVEHKATLLKDKNGVVQIFWSKSSSILAELRKMYADTYDYLVEAKNKARNKKRKIKLPKKLTHEMSLCSTSTDGVFLLKPL